MSRRIVAMILIVLAIAAVGTSVGFGAYHAGYDNGLSDSGQGTLAPAHGGYWHGYPGFGVFPGFFVFPLVWVLVIVLIVTRRRRHWGHWTPSGDAPAGCAPYGPRAVFEDWHRQAHAGRGQDAQSGEGNASA